MKAVEIDPDFSEAHFQLALMYQKDDKNKASEPHYLKAIALDSFQIFEIEKRADMLLKKFQFQNAKILFMKAQNKKYHCAKVNYELSIYYVKHNKLKKAQTCLTNSIALKPSFAKAYRELGILLLKQKNYNKALIHFEKALDLDYSDYIVHFKLGIISKINTQYADAEQYFLSALDIHPQYVDCLLEMANLQIIMKNKNEANGYYNKAKKISSNVKHKELDKIP